MADSIWIFALFFVFRLVIPEVDADDKLICNQQPWCNTCILASKDCAWCNNKEFEGYRCSTKMDLVTRCDDLFYPVNNETLQENKPLQDGDDEGTKEPRQLQPHRVKVRLRPGMTHRLEMKYRIAHNLPIDMYFVLDFSTTMKHRLEGLADLTQKLIDGLKQTFTKNIFIGFGSFLDKPVQPFHITTPDYLENPCILSGDVCEPSYGYIHRSKLNSDTSAFISAVKNGKTSANFDPMEGGLDAVLQASVCPTIVGWREQSRRVMVYISDSGFHFAGDGKLAGIDKPNDGHCHLIKRPGGLPGEYQYTESVKQDYPSLGHIMDVLDKNNINTFFVVDSKDKHMYEDFSNMIKQAETTTMDSAGADGIVQSITDYYTKISQKVTMSAKGIPDELNVELETDCASGAVKNTRNLKTDVFECKQLTIGKEVIFSVIMSAHKCPAADENGNIPTRTFTIQPDGLQESLVVEVEYICDCDCPKDTSLDQDICTNGNGTYECGVCRCKEGRSGVTCQCDNKETGSGILEENCKLTNTSALCENNGKCQCGQCRCDKNFAGTHCQCNTQTCKAKGSNEMCGGKGKCDCDKCKCFDGYSGVTCDCPPESFCKVDGLICSGHGTCKCGVCTCDEYYSGTKCEECPRCEKCRKCGYLDCVKCQDINKPAVNTTSAKCAPVCANITVANVDMFEKGVQPCGYIDTSDCEINYLMVCDENTETLKIAKTKQCRNPPDPLKIALPLLASIIGVGILLLIIWKILTSFYDKIEYARFEHETTNPKWSKQDNPIYKTPVTTNENPMYQGTVD